MPNSQECKTLSLFSKLINYYILCYCTLLVFFVRVVCKMLGHSYSSNSRKPIAIGGGAAGAPAPGPFGLSAYMCTLMDAVDCIGWESNLGQCGWVNTSPSKCSHNEDAAVDCNPGCSIWLFLQTFLSRFLARQMNSSKFKCSCTRNKF